MLYFAYGSNLSVPRLRQRVPSAQPLGIATLDGHRLAFHKIGRDGSAKCDAALAMHDGAALYGVVYRIDPRHRPWLDEAEGLGSGYEQKTVEVRHADGTRRSAFTYCATHIDPALRPYPWYKEHVVRGARAQALPADHVALIEAVDTVDDPDPRRQQRELAIYR